MLKRTTELRVLFNPVNQSFTIHHTTFHILPSVKKSLRTRDVELKVRKLMIPTRSETALGHAEPGVEHLGLRQAGQRKPTLEAQFRT